jgi:NAD(P)-dependent dehydrogenase (short-subunit alcohol dehydrogenase family)
VDPGGDVMTSLPLEGQSAIVTGAAVGVGRAIARALAGAGTAVTICDIRDDVAATAAALRDEGGSVEALRADVSVADEVLRVVDAARGRTGRVEILVSNAGIVCPTPVSEPFDVAVGRFDETVATNLRGPYLFGRAVIPVMVAQGGGNIVNVATDHIHTCGWPDEVSHADADDCPWSAGRRRPGAVGMDAYDASKWGLNGLTQDWAKSLRSHGIRVNNLCLGATDSHMLRTHAGFAGDDPPPAELLAMWMDADTVAGVVLELILEGPAGRSGDNIGLWRGHPTVLPPPSPLLDLPPDYDPAEARRARSNKAVISDGTR